MVTPGNIKTLNDKIMQAETVIKTARAMLEARKVLRNQLGVHEGKLNEIPLADTYAGAFIRRQHNSYVNVMQRIIAALEHQIARVENATRLLDLTAMSANAPVVRNVETQSRFDSVRSELYEQQVLPDSRVLDTYTHAYKTIIDVILHSEHAIGTVTAAEPTVDDTSDDKPV